MHKAQDENGNHFPGETADEVTVELHDASNYSLVIETFSHIPVTTNGDISISPISGLSGNYYITIKNRNCLETTTAIPISFVGCDINYNFSTQAADAFGQNLKIIDGMPVIISGDVNQDGIIDSDDMISVDNLSASFITGYLPEDVNGDGLINSEDMSTLYNNASTFARKKTP
jgi:hypothetical protein